MTDIKSILLSKTIWGALISIISLVLSFFGIQLVDTVGWSNDLVSLIGLGYAVYGRIVATKKLV